MRGDGVAVLIGGRINCPFALACHRPLSVPGLCLEPPPILQASVLDTYWPSQPAVFPFKTEWSSVSRLDETRGPRKVCPACRLSGTARTTRGSLCVGTAGGDPEIFAPTHGPLTNFGSSASPSASPRIATFGLLVIGEAMPAALQFTVLLVLVSFLSLLPAGGLLTIKINDSRSLRLLPNTPFVAYIRSTCSALSSLPAANFPSPCCPGPVAAIASHYARSVSATQNGVGGFMSSIGSSSQHTGAWSGHPRGHASGNEPPSRSDRNNTDHERATGAPPHPAKDVINLIYWNIFHDFTLKLTSPEFHELLCEYDIMFFAETDMLPGEDEAADVPAGYTLVSLPRSGE
ncbi:hypothetical protein B0H13DRAFT_2367929 [Mycena leptocephala]|nr:hypothetical protein B0H13DRAFT_2367929 [Mycena leptocephala]